MITERVFRVYQLKDKLMPSKVACAICIDITHDNDSSVLLSSFSKAGKQKLREWDCGKKYLRNKISRKLHMAIDIERNGRSSSIREVWGA